MVNFTDEELKDFRVHFDSFDQNGDGTIDTNELIKILKDLGEKCDPATVKALIKEVDTDNSGKVEYNEFLAVIASIRSGTSGKMANFARVYEKQKEMIQVKGHSGVHSYAQEEMSAFAEHFNNTLKNDPELDFYLPIDPKGLALAEKVKDGVILAKFINKCVPDTIDERALNKRSGSKDLSLFKINENLNLVISSAKSIGVSTVNVGSTELLNGKDFPHIILGLIWQLVKIQLLNSINLKSNPLLIRLLEEGEELADLMKLPPDQLLLRWMNYHLKNSGSDKRVTNWSGDVKDSVAYTIVLNQIAPNVCDKAALNNPNMDQRAGMDQERRKDWSSSVYST